MLIKLQPQASVLFSYYVLTLYSVAISAVLMTSLSPAWMAFLLLGITLYTYQTVQPFGPGNSRYIKQVVLSAEQQWTLDYSNGEQINVSHWQVNYIHPLIVILSFRLTDRKTQKLILFRDALSADEHRQLRLILAGSK